MKSFFSSFFIITIVASCQPVKQLPKNKAGYVTVKYALLYYRISGEGQLLVLIHASFLDHNMWQQQVSAFSNDFKVITIDMPAHGRTVKGDSLF